MNKKLLWIDLEMTGLDPAKQHIIEIAAIITDYNFVETGRYEAIINQPESVLENAESWPLENMPELFEEVRDSEKDEKQVTGELKEFIISEFGDEKAILAGNSIHQDRRFIRQWWPEVESLLHYRMLDVSTLKVWLQGTSGVEYQKESTHRAMDDIVESINEFKWALGELKD